MQPHRDTKSRFRAPDAGHMIEMRVRQQNRLDVQMISMGAIEELIDLIAGIDHHARARLLAGNDVPVLEERRDGGSDDVHATTASSYHRLNMREPVNLTIGDVEAAAHRLRRVAWHTPLVHSAWLSNALGADVWLKLELVQATGSFKLRGAVNALARLEERQERPTVVVTASAGNHGLAIGWAARHFGIQARVHLPISAPVAKREALARLGVAVVDAPTYDAAEAQAHEDSTLSGATYISPYDDPDVMAGAATVAFEMLADRPSLDTIVAPLGGGGLLAGTAVAAKAHRRHG